MTEVDERIPAVEAESDPNWGRRLLWASGLLIGFVVVTFIASATVPRWWAYRIGDQVNGSITQGTTLGLVYGFVFTFLPRAPRALASGPAPTRPGPRHR